MGIIQAILEASQEKLEFKASSGFPIEEDLDWLNDLWDAIEIKLSDPTYLYYKDITHKTVSIETVFSHDDDKKWRPLTYKETLIIEESIARLGL